jgi:hypothetical protein
MIRPAPLDAAAADSGESTRDFSPCCAAGGTGGATAVDG